VEIIIERGQDEQALPIQARPDGDTEGERLSPRDIF
jgi:hypothetical protein